MLRLHKHFEDVKDTKTKHIEALKTQKENLVRRQKVCKKTMASKDDQSKTNMKRLTSVSNDVLDYFKGILTKGDIIINGLAVSRKYQTETEKILPWKGTEYLELDEKTCQVSIIFRGLTMYPYGTSVVQFFCSRRK